jgi:hypothetical protein
MSRWLVHYSLTGEVIVDAANKDEAEYAVRRAIDQGMSFENSFVNARNLDDIALLSQDDA